MRERERERERESWKQMDNMTADVTQHEHSNNKCYIFSIYKFVSIYYFDLTLLLLY